MRDYVYSEVGDVIVNYDATELNISVSDRSRRRLGNWYRTGSNKLLVSRIHD
jgi:hypothetical protein